MGILDGNNKSFVFASPACLPSDEGRRMTRAQPSDQRKIDWSNVTPAQPLNVDRLGSHASGAKGGTIDWRNFNVSVRLRPGQDAFDSGQRPQDQQQAAIGKIDKVVRNEDGAVVVRGRIFG